MTNSKNIGNYSRLSVDPTLGGMVDGVDFPHTGVFKALAIAAQGNFAILNAVVSSTTENFSIVQTDSSGNTQFVVGSGMVMRDGKAILVPSNSATTTFTSGTPSTFDSPASTGNGYFLLVVKADNTLGIRDNGNRATLNTVPQLTAGDIPVAMIRLAYGETSNQRLIQYFTTAKSENSVSIGYNASTVYTEVGTLQGVAGGTTLDSTVGALTLTSEDDVTVKLGGTASTDQFTVRDSSSEIQLSVQGNGQVNIPSLTASEIVITDSNKTLVSAAVGTYPSLAELAHLKGTSSAIQTQIQGLYSRSGGNITGDINVYKAISNTTTHATAAIEVDVDTTGAIQGSNTGENKGIIVNVNSSGDVNGNGANVAHAGTVINTGIDIVVIGDASESGTDKNIGLNVAVSDADTTYAAIFNGGNVGIGTSTPAAPLHVVSTDDGETLRLESTDAGAGLAPDLIFKRTSSSPATGDNLGSIRFLGTNVNDSGSGVGGDDSAQKAEHEFADIYARANDVTLNTEDGELYFRTFLGGTQRRRLDLTPTESVFNEDSQDINFRVESDDSAHMIFVDAGNNRVGINANLPESTLDVGGSVSIVSPSNSAKTALNVDNLDTNQQAIHIEASNIDANVLDITANTLTTHNALDISSTGLTTGKGINLVSSSVPADGATHVANAIVTANTSVNTQTVTGLLFDYNKTGETASGKTATVTGIHLDMDDDANHASGTVLMTGLDIDVTSATDAGTLTNTGLNVAVGGADTNYAALFSGGNVGIGTATPTEALHVNGNVKLENDGDILWTNTGTSIKTNSAGNDLSIKAADDLILNAVDDMFFQTGSDYEMIILEEGRIGMGTTAPINSLQINHTGADSNNGLMIVREDTSTADGDLLGGIGFDSTDGNVPSSVLESSAFIASIATEDHTTADKGGNLKFGVSIIGEDDDTVSTIVANVGQPDTITASAGANPTTHAGLNSRATTVVLGNGTYSPTVGDSGTLVIFEHANSTLALPAINNTTSVGVQFTVFNETGSAINAKITVQNSATVNGGAIAALDDIASYKAATFVCSGNNTWIRIG